MRNVRGRVLLGFAAFGGFWGTWGATLPQVQAHARVNDAQLGTALFTIGLGALLSIRLAGGLADRFPRATLPTTLVLLAVAGALPALVVGAAAFTAVLAFIGLASGAADAAINAGGARVEAGGQPVLSLAHGVFSVAAGAASLVVAAVSSDHSRRPWPLIGIAGLLVLVAAITAVLPPGPAVARAEGRPRPRWSRPLVVLGLLAALAYLVENAWQSWSAIQLHSTLGASLRIAALGPAVFAGFAAAGRFAGHRLADVRPAVLLGTGAGVAAAGSALAALGPDVALVMVGIAVAGLGTSVCAPTIIGVAGRLDPSASGATTSSVITIAYLGFVFGPAAVGLVSRATTLPSALVGLAAVAATLALASPLARGHAARSVRVD